MAENITVVMSKGDLQPLANNIKTLNGLSQSDLVTLNEMEKAIEDANDAVDSQEDLIAQISAALEGKVAGGGGSAEPVLQEKTVSPSTSQQNVIPDSGYDGLSKVTVNAMPAGSVGNPSISVSSSGLITATTAVNAGYVDGTDKSGTKQLIVQAAQTIIPGTSNKTIASGRYLTGTQTIKGDANLVAGNIKNGISIFGVSGAYEGDGGGSGVGSIETCTVTLDTSTAIAPDAGAALVWATVENGEIIVENLYVPAAAAISAMYPSITCIKGSSIFLGFPAIVSQNDANFSCTGGVQVINYAGFTVGCEFKVTGDGSITWVS